MKYSKYNKNKKGFTLIEVLVASIIMVLLASMMLFNVRGGEKQLTLQRSAHKIAQDIRRVQEMAMSAKEFNGSVPLGGFGLYFDKIQLGPTNYLIFADLNGNKFPDLPGEEVESIDLERNIKFSNFFMGPTESDSVFFVFIPPNPQICINNCNSDSARIIISITDNPSKTKTIKLNKVGLIEIE